MSDKDNQLISEIFLSEIKIYSPDDDKPPQGSSGRMEFDPYSKDEYRRPGEVKKTKLSNKSSTVIDGRELEEILQVTDEYYSDEKNIFQSNVNERLGDRGYIIAKLPSPRGALTQQSRFILAKYVMDEVIEVLGGYTDWYQALNHAKTLPDSGVS